MNDVIKKMILPEELQAVLSKGMDVTIPETRDELLEIAMGGKGCDLFKVEYDVPGKGRVTEATVARCKNGAVVNYSDIYMRRRDPECMLIADQGATDKVRYSDKVGSDFSSLRALSFEWLATMDLIVMPFTAGVEGMGTSALLVAPNNAGFFAGGLADLQGFIPASEIPEGFTPKAIIYLAPTFRHTHFNGKQMVVHNRLDSVYEMFAYNLYPGQVRKRCLWSTVEYWRKRRMGYCSRINSESYHPI